MNQRNLLGGTGRLRRIGSITLGLVAALALAGPAIAVESPPTGISPSEFATSYQGCLGSLRSLIAQGEFAGVGPFGEHFTGQVNPGVHQGTVGEEEFLVNVIGVIDLEAFCAQFE
jgi:hypothetical protein